MTWDKEQSALLVLTVYDWDKEQSAILVLTVYDWDKEQSALLVLAAYDLGQGTKCHIGVSCLWLGTRNKVPSWC